MPAGVKKQLPRRSIERHAAAGHGRHGHELAQAQGRQQGQPFQRHAAHGMAHHAEGGQAQRIGQRQRVAGDLVNRVRSCRATHAAIAAIVHEDIAESAAIEGRFHRRERVRVAKPAVQNDDGVGTMAHAMTGIVHVHS
ncbi:hypothetical protein D3C72_1431600 [compost metagenome]